MAHDGPVTRTAAGVTVAVRLTPGARRQGIEGIAVDADGKRAIRIAVTAPPADGRANAALIALLARAWRVPKGSLSIRSGAAARRKVLGITGDAAALERRIAETVRECADG